jgi:hypothetical protein
VAVTAEFLLDSIEGVTETGHISKEFVGIILLPIVGNAAGRVLTFSARHLSFDVAIPYRACNCCNCVCKGQTEPQPRCCRWIEYRESSMILIVILYKCFLSANRSLRHSVSILRCHCSKSTTHGY